MKDISNKTLYGSISELKQIEDIFDDEQLEERKAELVGLIQSKADAIVYYNQSQCDYLEAIENRIKELQELKKTVIAKQDRFDKYILDCLKTLGVSKISGNLMSITARKPVKKVYIYDEKLIDPRFIKTKIETSIDVKAISDALKSGEEVDGANLIDGKESIIYKAGK